MRLSDFAPDFLLFCQTRVTRATLADYRRCLRDYIEPQLGEKPLHTITSGDMLTLQGRLAHMPARSNRVCMVAMRLMRIAQLYGHKVQAERPPMLRERRRSRYLTREEATRLMHTLDKKPSACGLIIRILLLTGCRRSEILALLWSEVDFSRKCFELSKGKTGARTVPVSGEVLHMLAALPRASEYVFAGRRGHLKTFQRYWERTRREAGLQDFHLHDLRHSFASFAITNGVPLAVVGHVLGHKSPGTTARYAHVHDEAAQSAVERVSSLLRA